MQFDVVCIGGGFSGLIPANRAAEAGLSAAVLEARSEQRYPCSSRYSTGVANIMGLPILAEQERLFRAIMDGSGANAHAAVARAIADNGKRTIDWLSQQGATFVQRALQHDQPGQQVLAPPRRPTAGLDWEDRGPDLFMQRLEKNLKERRGVVMRGTRAEELVVAGSALASMSCATARASASPPRPW